MLFSRKKLLLIIFAVLVACLAVASTIIYLKRDAAKRIIIDEISSQATSYLGQELVIGNMSFSLSEGVTFSDILIKNPDAFPSGDLLKISRLHLGIEFEKLLKKEFDFTDIVIIKPVLTLRRDGEGRLNISEKFLESLKEESKTQTTFSIDALRVEKGFIDLDGHEQYRLSDISLVLRDLSSLPEIKTIIHGKASYGKSSITVEGSAYLMADPKQLFITVKPEDLMTSPVRHYLPLKDRIQADIREISSRLSLSSGGEVRAALQCTGAIEEKEKKFINAPAQIEFSADARMNTKKGFDSAEGNFTFSTGHMIIGTAKPVRLEGKGTFDSKEFSVRFQELQIPGGKMTGTIQGKLSDTLFPLSFSLRADTVDIAEVAEAVSLFAEIPYGMAGTVRQFTMTLDMQKDFSLSGKCSFSADELSVLLKKSGPNLLKEGKVNAHITCTGKDISLTTHIQAGNVKAKANASIKTFDSPERSISVHIDLPRVEVSEIRNAFWDIFPDSLLYAGLQGSIGSDFDVHYTENSLEMDGVLELADFILEGENFEYSIGPVNGEIPVIYSKPAQKASVSIPVFDRSEFSSLYKDFSGYVPDNRYSKLNIRSVNYGFRMLEDINIWMKKQGSTLKIEKFDGNIFGGTVSGAAFVGFSGSIQYRAGFLLKGVSLTELCNRIEPIQGYISGNVDAIGSVKGLGKGLSGIIGKADFWSYPTKDEETKISKEFLKKVGGPSLKTYIGDREFDKGIMTLYLQKGYLIFDKFEISNRNFFGMQDLSIKVAPFNNRIAIDHLMWSIVEAAQRAKEKQN